MVLKMTAPHKITEIFVLIHAQSAANGPDTAEIAEIVAKISSIICLAEQLAD